MQKNLEYDGAKINNLMRKLGDFVDGSSDSETGSRDWLVYSVIRPPIAILKRRSLKIRDFFFYTAIGREEDIEEFEGILENN